MGAYAEQVPTVRLLMGDTEAAPFEIFSDDEIETFINLAGGNVYRAAARALYAIAANTALTLKVLTILDVHTDGKATAEGIITAAKALDDKADDEEASTIICGAVPTVAHTIPTHLRPWWEAIA